MALPGRENGISLKRVGTVIIASDAPSLRAEVAAALGEPGTDVVEVHTGQEVARKVKEHTPELVVVDMQMGNMGAMAVCMELRLEASYGNLQEVPVLMLVDRRADVFLARRAGAQGWLVKPLDPLRLRKAAAELREGGSYHDRTFEPVSIPVPHRSPAASDSTAGVAPAGNAPAGVETRAVPDGS
jgi:DNA-binding response OmpR family regulator